MPVRIQTERGVISQISPLNLSPDEAVELPVAAPGLFDLQLNGYRGIWFSSESLTVDEVETVIHDFARQGIARCLPTLITNSTEAIAHGLNTIRLAVEQSDRVRAMVAGCHVEGPFISPENGPRGAHPVAHVRPPCLRELAQWQSASGGLLRLITLAPEWPETEDFIRAAVASGITIAIGHTAAAPDRIRKAIDAGACLGTHLGNGCAGMVPRHDNVFWPQLADDRLTCSVIADGWHVPATMLKCILRCKTLSRLVLTCDVSGFGGCAPGRYSTDAVDVDVLPDGRIVVAGQTQYLAGSGATTGECVAHLMSACELSLAGTWPLASSQPANLTGCDVPRMAIGEPATLTLFRMEQANGAHQFRPHGVVLGELVELSE